MLEKHQQARLLGFRIRKVREYGTDDPAIIPAVMYDWVNNEWGRESRRRFGSPKEAAVDALCADPLRDGLSMGYSGGEVLNEDVYLGEQDGKHD